MLVLILREVRKRWALGAILALSVVLGTWQNDWGTPSLWNPDEGPILHTADQMLQSHTLDPGRYMYGSAHYFLVIAGGFVPGAIYRHLVDSPQTSDAAEPPEVQERRWQERRWAIATVFARTTSALAFTGVVLLTYLLGNLLFGDAVGLLSALLLAASLPPVAIAHFLTVDSHATFWFYLSLLLAVVASQKPSPAWVVASCLATGVAVGLKADRIVLLIPLAAIFLVRRGFSPWSRWNSVASRCGAGVVFLGLIVLGFIVANPVSVFSFFKFADGWTRELFFNAIRSHREQSASLQLLHLFVEHLGVPLCLAVLFGVVHALWQLKRRDRRPTLLLLLGTIAAYTVLVGRTFVTAWYLPVLLPLLYLLLAHAFLKFSARFGYYRLAVLSAMIVLAGAPAAMKTVILLREFGLDTRAQAAYWLSQHAMDGATVEIGPDGPNMPHGSRVVPVDLDPESFDWAVEWRDRLEANRGYGALRHAILTSELVWARWTGRQARLRPYTAWFDGLAEDMKRIRMRRVTTKWTSLPDFVVVIKDYQAKRLADLGRPDSGYRVAARFEARTLLGFKAGFDFVSPTAYVFAKVD